MLAPNLFAFYLAAVLECVSNRTTKDVYIRSRSDGGWTREDRRPVGSVVWASDQKSLKNSTRDLIGCWNAGSESDYRAEGRRIQQHFSQYFSLEFNILGDILYPNLSIIFQGAFPFNDTRSHQNQPELNQTTVLKVHVAIINVNKA